MKLFVPYFKLFLACLSILLILGGCNPSKRLQRLLKRNPSLIKVDTIYKQDTIYSESVSKDSTFNLFQTDTIVLKQDKLIIKYYFNHDSTIYLKGEYKADTIYRNIPVQVNSISVVSALTWWDKCRIWIFSNWWWIALIILIIWYLIKKFYFK